VDSSAGIEIDQVQVTCRIDGRQLAVTVDFEARTKQASSRMALVQGDVVLEKLEGSQSRASAIGVPVPPLADGRLEYDPNDKAYYVIWPAAGRHRVAAAFMARSLTEPGQSPATPPAAVGGSNPWRQARLQVPHGRVRQIRLISSQPDLEVQLPGALRVQRHVEQGQLVMEALLGPREPLEVRWKPQVQLADAKLVLSSQANTVVDVRAGLMQVDAQFDFQIAQGKLETLTFNVPAGLSITALDGPFIRTWVLGDKPTDGLRPLRVELSRPQDKDYHLHIRAEATIDALPATVEVPAVEPTGDLRASGYLAVGTNSALQLVVQESSGLTQIDAAGFPRVQASDTQVASIPQGKAFFYTHAGSRYRLRLLVDDIASTYEVAGRLVAKVKEDDLVVEAELELDVRDAPLRQLEITAPAGLVVAAVDGNQVGDYHLPDAPAAGPRVEGGPPSNRGQDARDTVPGTPRASVVRVVFKQPVIGRTLLHLRLELGRSPLAEQRSIPALQVVGAKAQRGYVVVAADPGIDIDPPQVGNLREIHTASVPLRVAQAQYAYRFRDADWTLSLMARRRPAEVRVEVFQLQSIGEAIAYGSAVINYVITGSPLDELRFRLPEGFENVEFVGRDVRRWVQQDGVWVVKLNRKVLGDYSLAATYTQRYGADRPIQLGALHCQDVQTQTGYVAVTSHLDLRLQLATGQAADQTGLLPVALDEVPADYRLLTSGPVLAAYKYVTEPHTALLAVDPYQRSGLLPVVVDIADLQTRLAVRPDKRIESMTTIRYEIKNTTGQFLALAMPAEARVWAVSQVEPRAGGGEQATRLAASHEQDSGRLLIPLRRQANPNDPTTIELEYGQVHQSGAWWKRTVDLAAPCCTVPITYANWQITVPQRWAIAPAGGNMQARTAAGANDDSSLPGLARLVQRIALLWQEAFDRVLTNGTLWAFVGLTAVLVAVTAVVRRQHVPDVVVFAALVLAVWIGVEAGVRHLDSPKPPASLSYAQAVSVDSNQALRVSADVVPAWRWGVRISDLLGVAAIMIVTLLVVGRRSLRKIALAAEVSALVYLSAKLPITWPVLKVLMTWLVPAAVTAWFVYRLRHRPLVPARAVAVTLILLIVFVSGGCSGLDSGSRPAAGRALVQRVECTLSAGADSMELKYALQIRADRPSRLALLEESAVLVSTAKPNADVTIQAENGHHIVQVDKPGTYTVEAVFLAALPPAGEDQQRRFELALPVALTNRVRLVIPDANVSIEAPEAVFAAGDQRQGQTQLEAMFAPGRPAVFTWRPLERQAAQEAVRFYAQDIALANVTPGLLQVFHAVRLQIAQGQMDKLMLDIAPGQTVTSVNGPQVGAWRFDPAGQHLEVRLSQPATGSYAMTVVTQSANAGMPYDIRLEPLVVQRALDQHSVMGLAAEPSVYVQLEQHPAAMNVQDYVREAGDLVKVVPGLATEQISHAFRFESQKGAVTGRVQAVQSEVRSRELARFNVEDDRLVYNSQWEIEIAKAGRFDLDLLMPEGFDIDTLEAQEISHWDESPTGSASGEAGQRRVRVHFKRKLTGSVRLKLALSQAIAEIPDRLTVPCVTVVGGLKHGGTLVIGSEQGVRVSVASRQGVSEVNPAELGQTGQGLLTFQFLRPDWQLQLQTELIQARVTVQSLHVAKVTDGLVRHQHSLRYRLYHAGTKAFALTLPPDAVGVTITGPGIARREQPGPGQWSVELADKIYDQPYLMRVAYETRYNSTDGNVPLVPVRCPDADLQQGYTVVFATDRVELAAESTDAILRPADARSIPEYFGAGDLAGAAMCYRSVSPQYSLTVRAKRHAVADQIGAEVLKTDLVSVVTAAGQTINHVVLLLHAGSQRHLQTILPEGASIWSLAVDGQAVQPSLRTTPGGRSSLLVPLPQQASEEVLVDMIYIAGLPLATPSSRTSAWSGRHTLSGPRFDLPLKNITWQVYMPQGFTYGDFGGTLTTDARIVDAGSVSRYDMQTYQQQILEVNRQNDLVAQNQQTRARELAQKGEQTAARQALTKGYNFSVGNTALNEDIRVDLDNLVRQQAKVGLINAWGRLRQQTGGASDSQAAGTIATYGQGFNQQQAERVESSLGQADSENLELITRRILQTQAAAETSISQIQVTMPIYGQVLRFDSPLQVEPAAEMAVAFTARPQRLAKVDPSLWYGFGLFGLLLVCGTAVNWTRCRWAVLCESLRKAPAPARDTPGRSNEPPRLDDHDDPDGQVSADELL
jgi:hypothetical protein